MIQQMTDYFTAEKQESLLFVTVGMLAVAVAIWLWLNGHRLKSMAFPLLAIALIQIVVGGSVYLRTDNQLAQLAQQWTVAPTAVRQMESTRMQTVMKNFSIYKAIEIALLLVGMLLIVAWRRSDLATGIGVGLVLQGAFMLGLDLFAEARGQDYLKALAMLSR